MTNSADPDQLAEDNWSTFFISFFQLSRNHKWNLKSLQRNKIDPGIIGKTMLTLKVLSKIVAHNILIFYFYFSEKIRLAIS